eukprot:CAMPEP_0113938732 /NCGR_PEP_ID=MMETSP1339-20121228/5151_1 /TAXON_ID=94617 /ORGANISM="Fibrocapsa japonica" /LENGTH=593 /DNA_ID=CAMNT_0000941985 /DNA_START=62 /DNA_END=1843 /DNA_ORIENTATION=+ /assembly_acc=CAM_ASM_000762
MLALWICMTIVGCAVTGAIESDDLSKGNPWRLINGVDYQGQICGVDSDVNDLEEVYYMPSGAGVCISTCPSSTEYTNFFCEYDTEYSNIADAFLKVSEGKCMFAVKSQDVFNYCVPDISSVNATELQWVMDAAGVPENIANAVPTIPYQAGENAWFDDFTSDMLTAVYVIFGFGLLVSMGIGFVYLVLLRFPGMLFLLTWGMAFLVAAMWFIGAIVCITEAQKWESDEEHSDMEALGLKIFGYVLIALGIIWIVFLICLRKRIQLAISIIKEASKSIMDMPLIVLFPVIQVIGTICFLIPWIIYVLYLASSGEVYTYTYNGISMKGFSYDDNIRYAFLYLLFCWFWTSQFIVAVGQMVVAMAVSMWYFTRDKSEVGSSTLLKAIRLTFFYHFGTAAFGSLLIAVVKFIRAVLAYIQKKANKAGGKVLQVVLCCCQCCLWCLEQCMKFMNKNAYIQTALFGYSFCKAARKAFSLIARNILRVAAVALVGNYVLLIGKLVITVGATFLAFVTLDAAYVDKLHGLYAPTIVVFILSYVVSHMFVEVFGMAMYAILQCFIADEEMYGSNSPFASPELASAIDKTATDAKNHNIHTEH